MTHQPLTQEYILTYFELNDIKFNKLLTQIKDLERKIEIDTLKNENVISLMKEKYENLWYREHASEQRIVELNNTILNHFAYKKEIKIDEAIPECFRPSITVPIPQPPSTIPSQPPKYTFGPFCGGN